MDGSLLETRGCDKRPGRLRGVPGRRIWRGSSRFSAKWILLVAGCLLLWSGCDRSGARPAAGGPQKVLSDAYPIRVAVTVGMVADIVRAVGGEQVAVTQLMGSGIDPHSYKSSRDDAAAILQSDMVFFSGLMLEGKMAESLRQVADTRPAIAVAEGIDESLRLQSEDGHAAVDPHLWMDARLWSQAATVVARALAAFDPTHAEDYHQRARNWQADLTALEDYCRKCMQSIPEQSRVLVTSHDAFRYFGRAYGIEVLGIQGISTESEAGLQRINELVELLVTRRIPAVFCESSVARKSLDAVVAGARSRGHEVRVLGPLFSDSMGPEGSWEGTYQGMLDHNATLIARGLGGEAPADGWKGKLGKGSAVQTAAAGIEENPAPEPTGGR